MKALERKSPHYDFGSRLRAWENPDFISRALSGDSDGDHISRRLIERSAEWLIPAISVDAKAIIERVPLEAITHLYLVISIKICRRLSTSIDWDVDEGATNLEKGSAKLVDRPNIGLYQFVPHASTTAGVISANDIIKSKEFDRDIKLLSSLALKIAILFVSDNYQVFSCTSI